LDTTQRYITVYELLTGEPFVAYLSRTGAA
jgi:hypothetical protein